MNALRVPLMMRYTNTHIDINIYKPGIEFLVKTIFKRVNYKLGVGWYLQVYIFTCV